MQNAWKFNKFHPDKNLKICRQAFINHGKKVIENFLRALGNLNFISANIMF